MQCTSPKLLPDFEFRVPCGKCIMCRIARSREWATRCLHEMNYHEDSVYVTLTYCDEFLPPNGSLVKDDVQRFFKRLRKNSGEKIKYFLSGEYGSKEKTERPHYHAIIFGLGLSVEHQKLIKEAWGYGYIKFGTCTYDSARYVADYIFKKYDGKMAEYYSGKVPPFRLVSKGLGLQWALDNRKYLTDKLGLTIKGTEVGMPRYYGKKLEITTDQLFTKSQEYKNYLIDKFDEVEETEVYPKIIKEQIQKQKNVIARHDRKYK